MPQNIDLKFIEGQLLGQGVEFAAFINKQGRAIDCAWKNQINLSEEEKEMFFMMNSLNLTMQGDYDNNLGTVQYTVTERENSKIISIPVPLGSIVLVAKKEARLSFLVKKISNAIDYVKSLNDNLPCCEITA